MTTDRARAWALLRRQLREHRVALRGAILGGIGWQLAGIVVPIVVGWTIDHGIVDGDRSAIWRGGGALLLLGAIEAGGAALRHRMACTAYMDASASLRSALTGAALGLDTDDRTRFPPGEVLARATSDTDTVGGLLDAVGHTVSQALSIPVILVVLALIDGPMALAVVLTVPVTAAVVWRSSASWERRNAQAQAAGGRTIEAAEETVEGFKVLRGLGAEGAAVARFERRSEELRVRATAVGRLALVFEPLLDAMSVASVAIVLWLAGDRVIAGELALGGAVTAVGLVLFLSGPVRVMGERILTVQSALASASRIVAVLDAGRPLDVEADDPLGDGADAVLRAAAVRVERQGAPLVSDVDLIVGPGDLVVLDGPTGSGKSTLLVTLAGLRATQGGRVLVGDLDVTMWATAPLRRRIAVCGPSPFLFAGSIGDNLRFADGSADEDNLWAALRATACDFVADLPHGLDASLGERGVSLSGGQRQRLALARAVLARPSVLFLDGATTALDATTEAAVVDGLRRALPRTGIVIVTTNATVRATADRVLGVVGGQLEVAR